LVEPLVHFAVPFASLTILDVDWREAVIVSVIALAPDLDALFHVHRSVSHSAVVLAAVILPLLILARKQRATSWFISLGGFAVMTHLVLDLFSGFTPMFWPLLEESMLVSAMFYLRIGSLPAITGSLRLLTEPTVFEQFVSFDQPILTGPGLAASSILLIPMLVRVLRNRAVPIGKLGLQ
jgi:hypothetical protein